MKSSGIGQDNAGKGQGATTSSLPAHPSNLPGNPLTNPSLWKQWARQHLKGVENVTMPSFTPNFLQLNEAGIRLDVQQSSRHGFFATMAATAGLDLAESMAFLDIVADEAKGKILAGLAVLFDSFDQSFAMLEHAARVGCSHVMLGYPPSFNPRSPQEVFDITKALCEAAPVGITLYPKMGFRHVSEEAIVDVLQELVSIPNVIAGEIFDSPFFEACQQRFGKEILIASPNPLSVPFNCKTFGQQWVGAGPYECFQSPDKPFFVQMVTALVEGNEEAGMKIFAMLQPAMESFMMRQMPSGMLGIHHLVQDKYFQWCTGGNGGYVRGPVLSFPKETMDGIRDDYRSLGIIPDDREDMFYWGRTNGQS